MRLLKHYLFHICFLFLLISSVSADESAKNEFLLRLKKIRTTEDVAKIIFLYSEKDFSLNSLVMFASLLNNKEEILLTDADLPKTSRPVQIRDIALACAQAITKIYFTPPPADRPVPSKEIVSCCKDKNGVRFREHISDFTDKEFEQIRFAVESWIAGFREGIKQRQISERSESH